MELIAHAQESTLFGYFLQYISGAVSGQRGEPDAAGVNLGFLLTPK